MNVFISYRRNDTQDLAGRLADRLRAVPQVKRVFIDVDGIEPGADFAARIQAAIAACDVCILLIGAGWRGLDRSGEPARIQQAGDFVRLEAVAALGGQRRILPVLANGATMPAAEELPEDLRGLPVLNALSVRHTYFDHDVDYLIDVLLSRKRSTARRSYLTQHPIQAAVLRAGAGAMAAIVVLIALAAIHQAITGRPLEATLGGQGQVWLLIVGSVLGGILIALRLSQARS